MEIPEFIEIRGIIERKYFPEDICRPMHYHFATAPKFLEPGFVNEIICFRGAAVRT